MIGNHGAAMEGLSTTDLALEEPKVSVEPPASHLPNGAELAVAETQLTPEQLVAKSIAPVKKEFLRPPHSRSGNDDQSDAVQDSNSAPLIKEKKSKRQLKRERRQKSALHLCPEVAKSGNVDSCRYNDKCRFSHDIEAFKAQKPDDLEGSCPFLSNEAPCPYGLACRFAGTHGDDLLSGAMNCPKKIFEINGLKKDTQKLLWKNKMRFHKADAVLKQFGLLGPKNSRSKKNADAEDDYQNDFQGPNPIVENGVGEVADGLVNITDNCLEILEDGNQIDGQCLSDEHRPLKKTRSSDCPSEVNHGGNTDEKDPKANCERHELAPVHESSLNDNDITLKLHPREKKLINFHDKLYLAPLTTVGNLPFRRVCKVLGADVTCGEMAMCTNLLQGQASEWALLRRHSSEELFGVQVCGAYPDTVARTVELIVQECSVDFIDINMGCPIDIVVNKGAGSALLTKPGRMKGIVQAAANTVDTPITIKVRTGYFEGRNRIDSLIEDISNWGATAVTIHGRSRQQRYSKLADWEYIYLCARKASETLQVLGNGDVFNYIDWNKHKSECLDLSTCMIARGALIKPWIFTEIKEQRHWDISSGERLDIFKDYVRFGLEHWGSDSKGVETTRYFLLEWLSYTHRYVPVGLLDVIPQRLNWRSPSYYGRNDLETLMASDSAADWIRMSEVLLGKVPAGFTFAPKHKSNAYNRAEDG